MDFTLNLLPRPNHRQATDNYFHQIGCYDNTSQKRHSNEGFNSRRRLKRRGNSPKYVLFGCIIVLLFAVIAEHSDYTVQHKKKLKEKVS